MSIVEVPVGLHFDGPTHELDCDSSIEDDEEYNWHRGHNNNKQETSPLHLSPGSSSISFYDIHTIRISLKEPHVSNKQGSSHHRRTSVSGTSCAGEKKEGSAHKRLLKIGGDIKFQMIRQLSWKKKGDQQQQQHALERPRKNVSFETTVEIRTIPPVADLTDEPLWFRPEEYRRIERGCKDLVRRTKMEQSPTSRRRKTNSKVKQQCAAASAEDEADSVRGLEKMRLGTKYKRCQVASWYAVFREQDYQLERGTLDPESIAKAYSRACRLAVLAAHERAEQDARDVALYMHLENRATPTRPRRFRPIKFKSI